MIRYVTAGESHGKALTVIIDGMPAGLNISMQDINPDLSRRQQGFGRGARMRIENDTVEILSGVRWGQTLGSPICLLIRNNDWAQNADMMAVDGAARNASLYQTSPRPGHADLAGIMKFERSDMRDILERASARETAVRVAAGAVCRKLLQEFGIDVLSWVVSIGNARAPDTIRKKLKRDTVEASPVRCPHKPTEKKMISLIQKAQKQGDTLGGIIELIVRESPPGLGSCMQWDKKLDSRLAGAVMSVQAIKGVEIGGGFGLSQTSGRQAHDEILLKHGGLFRPTNRAGGIEGGMTNGEDIIIRAAMKPIATLARPLQSVDIKTLKLQKASVVRSDVCAVPAAGVVGEAVVCIEIARVMKEKFGGDSIAEMKRNFSAYIKQIQKRFKIK